MAIVQRWLWKYSFFCGKGFDMSKTLMEVFGEEGKKWDGKGFPIRPTEVLPNGALVVDIGCTSPPPSERRRWFVLCVWDRCSNAQHYEYIVWELLPDRGNACERGDYTPSLLHAVQLFNERLDRAQNPWKVR